MFLLTCAMRGWPQHIWIMRIFSSLSILVYSISNSLLFFSHLVSRNNKNLINRMPQTKQNKSQQTHKKVKLIGFFMCPRFENQFCQYMPHLPITTSTLTIVKMKWNQIQRIYGISMRIFELKAYRYTRNRDLSYMLYLLSIQR